MRPISAPHSNDIMENLPLSTRAVGRADGWQGEKIYKILRLPARTFLPQKAFTAFRAPRNANGTPQGDDMYVPQNPVVLWQHLHQSILYLLGILLFCKAQLPGNALYMSIHHNTGSLYMFPRMTLAVLRPTPAREVSSSMVFGTSPPNRSTRSRQQAMIFLAFM